MPFFSSKRPALVSLVLYACVAYLPSNHARASGNENVADVTVHAPCSEVSF